MLAKRIIPCLDVKDGQTVKGTNFVNLREAGDPVELGKAYSEQGADELCFLDITASFEGRKTFTEMVTRVAREINIPFTVGGGINELADVERLLYAGADKVSVNSAAIRRPELIDEISNRFGSQVCVCAIDARLDEDGWHCYLKGGRERTERDGDVIVRVDADKIVHVHAKRRFRAASIPFSAISRSAEATCSARDGICVRSSPKKAGSERNARVSSFSSELP